MTSRFHVTVCCETCTRKRVPPTTPIPMTAPRETVILVHGTFAAPEQSGPLQWHEPGSVFAIALDEQLTQLKSPARCWAHARNTDRGSADLFSWTGANHWLDRENAASKLAALLDQLIAEGWRCHIVAHSHGGNVVLDALRRMKRSTDPGYADAWSSGSIVTLGTPFLDSPSMRHHFFPEMDYSPDEIGVRDSLMVVVKALALSAAFLLLLAVGLTIAGIDPLALFWNFTFGVLLVVTLSLAALIGVAIFFLRGGKAGLLGAASSSRWGRMLVLGSEHDEAWQLLNGLLSPKTSDTSNASKSSSTPESTAGPSRPVTRQRHLFALISNADLLAFPGRSLFFDVVVWGSVTVVIVGAAKFRIGVTPLLPYVGALYCGLLLAGFIGFNYKMRACVSGPVRAARSLLLGFRYLIDTLASAMVQRKAILILRMKAAGFDYFPNDWPRASRRPTFVSKGFFEYREVDDQQMLETRNRRDASVGTAIGEILSALGTHGIGAKELDALLIDIAKDTTLCHAGYYTNSSCISMIARWIARTEEELSREEDNNS
jgi:hypothetical protein